MRLRDLVFSLWLLSLSVVLPTIAQAQNDPFVERIAALDGAFTGVEVVRLSASSALSSVFGQTCEFYVEEFAKAYRPLFEADRSDSEGAQYTDGQMIQDIQKDCESDLEKLALPTSYFLLAREQVSEKILGLAVFEVLSPGRVYLSSWLATSYHGSRGLGTRLLAPVFEMYPEISSLELVVAADNLATVAIYKNWGFKADSSVNGPTYVQVKTLGMSLVGDAFKTFAARFRRS